ncbi:MAG TPA: GNAT family N-acetyltransferase, partial [Xanthobacteraceae bacterium]
MLDPTINQPVGPLVDASSAREPKAVVLKGRFGRIEKLDASRHRDDLWHALEGHDQVWTYLPYGPFADGEAFGLWLKARSGITDPFSYVVIDRDGHAIGIVALMAVRPEMRVIEVGNILLSPALQRTPLATEAQYLLAKYAFETLGYRRYEWKCDSLNAPSRCAAARYGFIF